jgi:hypothetical protein
MHSVVKSLLIFMFYTPLFAKICVVINKDKDSLSEQEQKSSRSLIKSILEEEGMETSDSTCSDTYEVFNIKIGNTIKTTIIKKSSNKRLSLEAKSIDELPNIYSQLIKSLLSNKDSSPTITRNNITNKQANPERLKTDNLYFFSLGYSIASASPAIQGGYRYELDQWAVELSFMLADKKSSLAMGALYFFSPLANNSAYGGAGIGLGATDKDACSGSGLEANAKLGYMFLRASTIRFFAQADVIQPIYKLTNNALDKKITPTPNVSLSFGVAYTM